MDWPGDASTSFRFPVSPGGYPSDCWIFAVLAFAGRYLNRPGRVLTYLSQAAYPVYILHMIFLYLGSSLVFPLDLQPSIKFVLVLLFTVGGCFAGFEVIRRTVVLRPFFGLKVKYAAPAELKPLDHMSKYK